MNSGSETGLKGRRTKSGSEAMNVRALFILIPLLVLLSGCGVLAGADGPGTSRAAGRAPHDGGVVREKLYSQYEEWRGVEYRLGGLSKRGVDCSGFVYLTYRSKFRVKLPRTTERLSEVGEAVKRSELRTGDLVFFKTGPGVRHVGIYLEKGKFLHASKRRGVMISRLNNVYWKPRFWKAKRIEM